MDSMSSTSCSKYANPFAERNEFPSHESDGARSMLHGFQFQFKLIMLWILRAVNLDINFEVATEETKLDKFDDFHFTEKIDDTVTSETFVQAKHSTSDGDIKFTELFTGKIDLKIYFKSFLKVFKNLNISDQTSAKFVLLTNRGLEYGTSLGQLILNQEIFEVVNDNSVFNLQFLKFKTDFPNRNILIKAILQGNKTNTVEDVNNFLNYFYIVVNAENIKNLEYKIKSELGKLFRTIDIDQVFNKYYKEFQEWYDCKKGTIIPGKSIKEYFLIMRDKITAKLDYNILSTNSNFYGRSDALSKINNCIFNEKNKIIDIIITGTAGVGKSELVRKFVELDGHSFQHVLWINAETKATLEESIVGIAKFFNIYEERDKDDFQTILRKANSYFVNRCCLLIYDNAETYFLTNISTYNKEINKNHRVIITSQLQDWTCTEQIELDVFSINESEEFLDKNIDIENPNKGILQEICKFLSYLPLALQLSISYINKVIKQRKSLGINKYKLEEFIKEYKIKSDKFLQFNFNKGRNIDAYKKSLFIAWDITFDNLKCEENGENAIEILHVLSYLHPENINLNIFVLEHCYEETLEEIIYLLKSYSLIKTNKIVTCSMHRLLQHVIRLKLRYLSEPDNDISLETNTVRLACKLINNNVGPFPYPDPRHVISIWNNIEHSEKLKYIYFEIEEKFNSLNNLNYINYLPILEEKLKYIEIKNTEDNDSYKKSNSVLDTLSLVFRALSIFRHFDQGIVIFEKYFKLDEFDSKYFNRFLETLCMFSYCYLHLKQYDRGVDLFDQFIDILKSNSNVSQSKLLEVYAQKSWMLTWQYKNKEALKNIMEIITQFDKPKSSEYKELDPFDRWLPQSDINPWRSRPLLVFLFDVSYISYGSKYCENELYKSLECFPTDCTDYVFVLGVLASLYYIEGNIDKHIECCEQVLQSYCKMKPIPNPVEFTYYSTLNKILKKLIQINAIFKKGSLSKLIEVLKKFIQLNEIEHMNMNCHPHEVTSFNEIRFGLAKFFYKNQDFEQSLVEFESHKNEAINFIINNESDTDRINQYIQSVRQSAIVCYHMRRFTKSIEILDNAITESQIIKDINKKLDLIEMKSDILLMENPADINIAIKYLNDQIHELEDVPKLQIKYCICMIYYKHGKYDCTMQILNEILSNKHVDSVAWACYNLKLNLLKNNVSDDKLEYTELCDAWMERSYMSSEYIPDLDGVIRKTDEHMRSYLRSFEHTSDKIKYAERSQVCLTREPFQGNFDYIINRMRIAYVHFKLRNYPEALLELDHIQKELSFVVDKESLEKERVNVNRLIKLVKIKQQKIE